MSIIDFPPVPRKLRAVPAVSGDVISHPRSIGELAAEAIERIESDRCAEIAMAEAHCDLDVAVLRLTAIAVMHERQTQAMTMLQLAMERMRAALA